MKKFKEIALAIFGILVAIAGVIFMVKKPSPIKTPEQINEELEVEKAKIEKEYEEKKEDILNKPVEVTISEYYEKIDKDKEEEIQIVVDEAMSLAEKYKVVKDE